MATLHGSWILKHQHSYLFIWGETWRTREARSSSSKTEAIDLHPFTMHPEELGEFCTSANLISDPITTESATQVISLPTADGSAPILSAQMAQANSDNLSLQSWQVEGLCLTPPVAVKFLNALPLGSLGEKESYLGEDLRFWSQVYRWSLDLLARSKFLPGLACDQEGTYYGYWQPLLDSAVDQARLAKFTRFLPSACRAYFAVKRESGAMPQELLLSFLGSILDAQVRSWSEQNGKTNKELAVQKWLKSLAGEETEFDLAPRDGERLRMAWANWTLPIQDYLSEQLLSQIGQNQFRTCFILEPPTQGEITWGHFDWKLNYYLRSVDDPEFLVPAAIIWQQSSNQFIYGGRTLEKPQEMLLKGLGLASRLYEPIEASLKEALPERCLLTPIQVYELIRAIVWQLEDNGLGVIVPPGLASGTSQNRLGIKIKAQVQRKKSERLGLKSLLKYKLELAIGNQTLSKAEFEQMMAQKSPLVEVNGEWMALQPADVKAAQAVLSSTNEELTLSVEDALRLSTGETKTLVKLPVVNFQATGVLQELIQNLNNNQEVKPVAAPKEFHGELRPYQSRGVGWLAFLERWGLGACLADDMGLGKTIETIAFLLHLKQEGELDAPILLVCPTSVLGNWEREVKKFAPTLKVCIHHGDKRSKGKTFVKEVTPYDVVLTSYPLVYRDEKTLAAVPWRGIVLDEAQNIKNPQAKQSQAVRKLKTGFRVALTGTPIENRLSELWSILDFLNPGFLGTKQFFQRRFAIPVEKYGDRDSLQILRSLVQPFILRRLKTDKNIIQDLPEKQEMNVFCGLSAEQGILYQKLVDESLEQIEAAEGIQRHGLILTLLMKLKQVCNHPGHYLKQKKLTSGERSGKLLRLEEMLEEVVAEGDRALIFTQFSEWGKLLKPYLEKKLGGEALFLYGATRRQQREEMVDRFQNDPEGPRILILSLKAGGTGLNLTRANHVFHVDRWWNPAVENQATDRAFRIGQKRNVQVHKFVCTGTLEERINEIIESKKQLAEQTVDAGEQWLTQMDTDSLRNLLILDRDAIIDEEDA